MFSFTSIYSHFFCLLFTLLSLLIPLTSTAQPLAKCTSLENKAISLSNQRANTPAKAQKVLDKAAAVSTKKLSRAQSQLSSIQTAKNKATSLCSNPQGSPACQNDPSLCQEIKTANCNNATALTKSETKSTKRLNRVITKNSTRTAKAQNKSNVILAKIPKIDAKLNSIAIKQISLGCP